MSRGPPFVEDGAQLFPAGATDQLSNFLAAIDHLTVDRPCIRLNKLAGLAELLVIAGVDDIAALLIDAPARPVRAVLFDKSDEANWALGWHQDRTIAVRRKIDTADFGPWTVKDGMPHVAPPYDLLARMVTLRIHLDPVTNQNAPLLVALGTHRLGGIRKQMSQAPWRDIGSSPAPPRRGMSGPIRRR